MSQKAQPLHPLDEDIAYRLLLQESHRNENSLEEDAAKEIVRILGGLPLAIELAGAYLRYRSGISFSQYLDKLRQNPLQALSGKHLSSFTGHDADIYSTLKIDEELFVDEPLLLPILDLLTWSGPAQMGIELIAVLLEKHPTELFDALGLGVGLRLLQKSADGQRFSIHRLVREVRRQERTLPNIDLNVGVICNRIGDWFEGLREDFDKLPIFEAESDHLSAWLENARSNFQGNTARLKWLQAYPPYHRGNYKQSLILLKKAQSLWNQFNKQDRCLEAHLCIDIGYILYMLGDYREALPHVQKSLEIRLEIFTNAHEDTATSYNFLGIIYKSFGKYPECLDLQNKALEMRSRIFNFESPVTAHSYSDIGDTYSILGDYEKAFEYHKKSVEIYFKSYGDNNITTAISYGNLADAYRTLGDLENAFEFANKSFNLVTNLVGEEHPQTATAYNALGSIYNARKEDNVSLKYATKAYEMRCALFGEEHPGAVYYLHCIGQCYSRIEEYQKALDIQKYTLKYFTVRYGYDHVNTAHYYESLGNTYASLDDYKQSNELLRKAMSIIKNNFGEKHPSLIDIYEMLARINRRHNKVPFAVELLKKSISLARENLPAVHPKIVELTEKLKSFTAQMPGFRTVKVEKKQKNR